MFLRTGLSAIALVALSSSVLGGVNTIYFPAAAPSTFDAYQIDYTTRTWSAAKTFAPTQTLLGQPGHLAALTTLAEAQAICAVGAGNNLWIGLTDNEGFGGSEANTSPTSAGWHWITSESYNGAAHQFGSGQPAALFSDSDYVYIGANGKWVDQTGGIANRSLLEFETATPEYHLNAWKVQSYKSSGTVGSLTDAQNLIAGTNLAATYTAFYDQVNLLNTGTGTGHFNSTNSCPELGVPGIASANDFAIRSTGLLQIPATGTYTFGITTDDGGMLSIDGTPIITDPGTHGDQDRFATVTSLTAGFHNIEWIWFQRTGGADAELYAALGTFTTFAQTSTWKLVGDDSGLNVVQATPEPGAIAAVMCALLLVRRSRKSNPS